MKIIKYINYKNKLLELVILNFFLEKYKNINHNKVSDIAIRFKKILHIVYKYHVLKKKILFLGIPIENYFYIEKIIKLTKHIAIPESFWINGLITNKRSCLKHLIKKQTYSKNINSKLLLKLNEQIDLILIISDIKNDSLLQEISNSQIPVISLNNNEKSNLKGLSSNYTLDVKFNSKKIILNFFFAMIKTLIKKIARKNHRLNLYSK